MGEVYKASDLALGQPVALKFLPAELSRNPSMVSRFYGEVRIARKVSHPNVCRVYDIGDVDGSLYISMEYVDGENLGSLLRRIGRLPADKAVEIARKLCAGLAAAHEKGILHRDLKPANIMLDGQGHVYIMDFGLAGIADQMQGAEIRNGTPAYMAPEQLAGLEVTTRSDIYSLGLVLYEIFTGKRPFEASTIAELIRLQQQSQPLSVSSVVRDLDPSVERAIVRCLTADPRLRPASALSVAASLPGGDPLAEALAAGETPSPELVAASGTTEGMRKLPAMLCLGSALVGVLIAAALTAAANAPVLNPLELSPDILAHKARETVARLGYREPLPGRTFTFEMNDEYWSHMKTSGSPLLPSMRGPETRTSFLVRESPHPIVQDVPQSTAVTWSSPAFDTPGMRRMRLDSMGDLLEFEAIPQTAMTKDSGSPDWNSLLTTAGLDPAKLIPVDPQWTPPGPFDARMAWTGTCDNFDPDLRVEAAAWRGRPVWFRMIPKWQKPEKVDMTQSTPADIAYQAFQLATFIGLIAAAGVLAWRHARTNRGDKRGATRIALWVLAGTMVAWTADATHVTNGAAEFRVIIAGLQISMVLGLMIYTFYLAIEPYIRRYWPRTLVSWSRVMTGQVRDPLVGRDILTGILFGLGWAALAAGRLLLASYWKIDLPRRLDLDTLRGGRFLIGSLMDQSVSAVRQTMIVFFCIFLLRAWLKREWVAAVAFALIFGGAASLGSPVPGLDLLFFGLVNGLFVALLIHYGLLCTLTAYLVFLIFSKFPVTLDFSLWYSDASLFALAAIAGLAVFGYRTAVSVNRADRLPVPAGKQALPLAS